MDHQRSRASYYGGFPSVAVGRSDAPHSPPTPWLALPPHLRSFQRNLRSFISLVSSRLALSWFFHLPISLVSFARTSRTEFRRRASERPGILRRRGSGPVREFHSPGVRRPLAVSRSTKFSLPATSSSAIYRRPRDKFNSRFSDALSALCSSLHRRRDDFSTNPIPRWALRLITDKPRQRLYEAHAGSAYMNRYSWTLRSLLKNTFDAGKVNDSHRPILDGGSSVVRESAPRPFDPPPPYSLTHFRP